MNREILFRGYTGRNWQYGYLIDKEAIRNFDQNGLPISTYRVIKETIGQYTGLTDKNGTKIFEGDVLKLKQPKDKTEYIAKVEFGNPNGNYNWGWQLVFKEPFNLNPDILCWVEMECVGVDCEVIGNIYDNPELLKED